MPPAARQGSSHAPSGASFDASAGVPATRGHARPSAPSRPPLGGLARAGLPAFALAWLLAWLLALAPGAAAGRDALRRDVEGYAMAACLTRQEPEFLRQQGFSWSGAILQTGHGGLDRWTALADAVIAEAARRPMPVAKGDGPVNEPPTPLPILLCHDVAASPPVRAAVRRAMRQLAPAYRSAPSGATR